MVMQMNKYFEFIKFINIMCLIFSRYLFLLFITNYIDLYFLAFKCVLSIITGNALNFDCKI